MAPTSYQAPSRGDKAAKETYSQPVESNLASSQTPVSKLLDSKGRNVIAMRPGDSIKDIVALLSEKRIGAVAITDQNGALQGILSERDIVRRMAISGDSVQTQTAEDLMTRNVVTCAPGDALTEVLKRMTEGKFRHMPVQDGTVLCGMITIGDVVNFRLTELEYEALRMKQMIVG
jgi:CBS domain-containing protein